jgi:AbiV family abortive infection protein
LGILCCEEAAKLMVVDATLCLADGGKPVNWPAFDHELRQHKVKLGIVVALAKGLALRAMPPETWEDLIEAMKFAKDEWADCVRDARSIDSLKQKAFYAGLTNGGVNTPETTVTLLQTDSILKVVDGLLNIIDAVEWR